MPWFLQGLHCRGGASVVTATRAKRAERTLPDGWHPGYTRTLVWQTPSDSGLRERSERGTLMTRCRARRRCTMPRPCGAREARGAHYPPPCRARGVETLVFSRASLKQIGKTRSVFLSYQPRRSTPPTRTRVSTGFCYSKNFQTPAEIT